MLDETSQLAEVDARLSLGTLEALLARRGFTLALHGAVDWSSTVASWIAHGFPGARDAWADPVASRVAGFEASAGGVQAHVRPAPRRATGPDLFALFAGTHAERFGIVERATLAVAPRAARESRVEPFTWDRDPPLSAEEARAFELARRALSGSPA